MLQTADHCSRVVRLVYDDKKIRTLSVTVLFVVVPALVAVCLLVIGPHSCRGGASDDDRPRASYVRTIITVPIATSYVVVVEIIFSSKHSHPPEGIT